VAAKIPTDFSTLLNEWDPIDLKEVYADGAGVASWVDSKASANLAQGTGADQPLFRAAVTNFGGLPGVDAVSGDFVSGTITNDNQATTWMMVIDDDQSSGNAQILQASQQIGYFGGNLAIWAGGSNLVSTYARAAGALFICAVFNGASSALYWRRIDAGAGAPSSVTGNCGTNGTGTTVRLGNHSSGTWPAFDGRYGPVVVFNAALTSTDVQDLFDGVLARINGGPETDHNILLSADAADAAVTVGSGTKKKAFLHAPGGSSTQVVKVSAAGPTAPLQMTDGAGTTDGTAIAWYTAPLTAVTIAGAISWAMWTQENATANNVAVAVKIERCSGDGTVLSTIVDPATSQAAGEAPTTAASDSGSASAANVTDTTLVVGDRLRITLWVDDAAGQGGTGNMGSGGWGKAWYGARSGQGLASLALAEALALSTSTIIPIGLASESNTAQPVARSKVKALGQPSEADVAQLMAKIKARSVGQPVESDAATAVTKHKSRLLGQGSEIDTSLGLVQAQVVTIGQPSETDTATVIAKLKTRSIGEPAETDVSQPVAERKTRTLGQPAEVDAPQTITRSKARSIGEPTETDLGQPVGRAKIRTVAQAAEVDFAQPVGKSKARAFGQALEVDAAQPVGPAKARQLGEPAEIDAAQPVAASTAIILGQPSETDTASAVGRSKTRGVGQAVEVVTPQPIARIKAKTLGQASESDQALALALAKYLTFGVAVELDTLTALQRVKTRMLGQPTELDLPVAVAALRLRVIGQPVETDEPLPLLARKTRTLSVAEELDVAFALLAVAQGTRLRIRTTSRRPALTVSSPEPGAVTTGAIPVLATSGRRPGPSSSSRRPDLTTEGSEQST
jgi:hypothetical protein